MIWLITIALILAARVDVTAADHYGRVTFGSVPVPGATVTAVQGDQQRVTITDLQGIYRFTDIAEGVLLSPCGRNFPIVRGIPRVLENATELFPEFVARHAGDFPNASKAPAKKEVALAGARLANLLNSELK